jgi:hypothetical protein
MRKVTLNQSISLRLSEPQRRAIEDLAERREISVGEACREFIDRGIVIGPLPANRRLGRMPPSD